MKITCDGDVCNGSSIRRTKQNWTMKFICDKVYESNLHFIGFRPTLLLYSSPILNTPNHCGVNSFIQSMNGGIYFTFLQMREICPGIVLLSHYEKNYGIVTWSVLYEGAVMRYRSFSPHDNPCNKPTGHCSKCQVDCSQILWFCINGTWTNLQMCQCSETFHIWNKSDLR